MAFKDNVLFYLNENKKKDEEFLKHKKEAGCEADGSSVRTCTGSEPSCDTDGFTCKSKKGKKKHPRDGSQPTVDTDEEECSVKTKLEPRDGSQPAVKSKDDIELDDADKKLDDDAIALRHKDPLGFTRSKAGKLLAAKRQEEKEYMDDFDKRWDTEALKKRIYDQEGFENSKAGKLLASKKRANATMKECISVYSGCGVISEGELDTASMLIDEGVKNNSASKNLLKISKKMDQQAKRAKDPEVKETLNKNAKLFKKAYQEFSAAEDAYKAGDEGAKADYDKLTKKYASQFKSANKNKVDSMIKSGCGVGALLILTGGSIIAGAQGLADPAKQMSGIGKLTLNSPLDGIKAFFDFSKKALKVDRDSIKILFTEKDFNAVKDYINKSQFSDVIKDQGINNINLLNADAESIKDATYGKGEVANAMKDFGDKISDKASKIKDIIKGTAGDTVTDSAAEKAAEKINDIGAIV